MPVLSRKSLFWQPKSIRDPAAGGAVYVGPGDVVSGALVFHGLRGYSAAYSTGSNKGIQVADVATGLILTDILILSNGALDVATVAGLGYAVEVSKFYDQSGHGLDSIIPRGSRSVLTLGDNGPLPCLTMAGESGGTTGTLGSNHAQPYVNSCVARRASGGQSTIAAETSNPIESLFGSGANTAGMYAGGSVQTAAAADGGTHSLQLLFNNASSIVCVDGSNSSVNIGTASGLSSAAMFQFPSAISGALTGKLWESGWWPTDISAFFPVGTISNSITTNQRTYWNF